MQIKADNQEAYIDQLPADRKEAITVLRRTILENRPAGFTETMSFGMIGYVIPYSTFRVNSILSYWLPPGVAARQVYRYCHNSSGRGLKGIR